MLWAHANPQLGYAPPKRSSTFPRRASLVCVTTRASVSSPRMARQVPANSASRWSSGRLPGMKILSAHAMTSSLRPTVSTPSASNPADSTARNRWAASCANQRALTSNSDSASAHDWSTWGPNESVTSRTHST